MGDLAAFLSAQKGYRRQFVEANGPGPWPCCFCGEPVEPRSQPLDSTAFVVHHDDEDRSNSDPSNLSAAHHGCHVGHHFGQPASVAKRTATRLSREPDYFANIARLGGRAVGTRRLRCDECGLTSNPGGLARHQSVSGHSGRTRLS